MKNQKQRVIAIDYFRGICILVVILSHSAMFSTPVAYLTGMGQLWTSGAEMFFLLSGITFGIVRGSQITSGFKAVWNKSWRRARSIYLVHISIVFISLLLAYFFISKGLPTYMPGSLPQSGGLSLVAQAAGFYYVAGLAAFLMYYVVFLLIAPFALYVLRTRFWAVVPLLSTFIFMMNASPATSWSHYAQFAIWQLYFFVGLTLARFRIPLISWFYSLPKLASKGLSAGMIASAGVLIAVPALLASGSLYSVVYRLAHRGWLPIKIQHTYAGLINHKYTFDFWLGDSRFGVLRPIVTLAVFGAAYILYQKHKELLLKLSGNFVNAMGRDTLWLFGAQAIVIPVMAALPVQRTLLNNLLLTSTLILLMWSVTKRQVMIKAAKSYLGELKVSYNEAKYSYIYRSENDA